MICISVTPTSRTLARVDLLNASRQGDIIELCIDHLIKEPDFKELLEGVDKPVIISCRRKQDGGHWEGTEEERLMLLRRAIVAGPDYIELDLDIAPQVPRFGDTQRVIAFTRLDRPEHDIDSVFDEAASHHADVIKFRWPVPTLDDAWPLLAAVSQRRSIPIVGQGMGEAELTFSLLGKKYGSPWIYAALEKGMEDHPGQATVEELKETYAIKEIDRKTKFIAIAGFEKAATETLKAMNAGFRERDLNMRCLPVNIQKLDRLAKMLQILKIKVLIADRDLGTRIQPWAEHVSPQDAHAGCLDLLLKQPDGWHGFSLLSRMVSQMVDPLLRETFPEQTLSRRSVLVVGTRGAAVAAVNYFKEKQAVVSVTGPRESEARQIAETFHIRHTPFQSLYDTHTDIVVLADIDLQKGSGREQFNPSYLRPDLFVLDLCSFPEEHPLTEEARVRQCQLIGGKKLWEDLVRGYFKTITGADLIS